MLSWLWPRVTSVSVDWSKVIPAALALVAGASGGGLVTNGYNSDEHQAVLASEQAKRDSIQRLLDSQTEAHERAMAAARADHAAAMDRAMAGYRDSLQAFLGAPR